MALRYKLNLRDLAEMFLERGFVFTHEAVQRETRFAPLLVERLRTKRRDQRGYSWYVDETHTKVSGQWCDLYRAIDCEASLAERWQLLVEGTAALQARLLAPNPLL